ncbi:MAG: hypothetical protein JSV52_10725 [Candidatus Zixiibacteriota bacterium]|nr:MAG: hypothetical protein JSV52_10725 [candidate division Zixibacteria bacterium]
MKVAKYIIALFLTILAGNVIAADGQTQPSVTYISPEAIYFDGGLYAGIGVGDTVAFIRDRQTVAVAIVTKAADMAAAAELCQQKYPVKVGDRAALLADVPRLTAPMATMASSTTISAAATEPQKPRPQKPSQLKGTLSIENFYRKDMTDSELDRTQPGIRTRLSVTNVGGTDLTLRLRHRTRLYHRARSLYTDQETNEWVHQVYEFGLFHEVEDARTEWAIGRVLSPYVRGVGYVDGGYLAHQLNPHFKLGLAGGTVPDRLTSEPDFDRRKFGLFASWETGTYSTQRLAFTAAVSTEYDKQTVSRDFLYFQTTYSKKGLMSLYQSVEIDLNRGWRYKSAGERFTFTNYYANATVNLTSTASLFASYDARKNIRYIELMDTPDSLFNDDVHQGVRAGFNWRPTQRLYIRANGGIRFREGEFDNNRFVSGTIRINRFPAPRHSVTMSMHVTETHFTTGYRPMLSYRFPVSRKMILNLTGSGYIYKTGSKSTKYYYGDISTHYNFGRRYYLSANVRQYFDSKLESIELRTELGIRL